MGGPHDVVPPFSFWFPKTRRSQIVMTQCLIAVGCNQGECRKTIRQAAQKIDELPKTQWISSSRLIESQPVGEVEGCFLNGVFRVDTEIEAHPLLEHLLRIEQEAGRDRVGALKNRPLDLDLLLFGQEIIQTPRLIVPHPRMTFRRFVMEPAAELVPEMWHPLRGTSLGQLWAHLQSRINLISVLVPGSFPFAELDVKNTANIIWVVPGNQPVSPEKLLKTRPGSDTWVVVLTDQGHKLTPLEDQIKLQIFMGPESNESIPQRSSFPGPSWEIPFSRFQELSIHVETAIQSMIS